MFVLFKLISEQTMQKHTLRKYLTNLYQYSIFHVTGKLSNKHVL